MWLEKSKLRTMVSCWLSSTRYLAKSSASSSVWMEKGNLRHVVNPTHLLLENEDELSDRDLGSLALHFEE